MTRHGVVLLTMLAGCARGEAPESGTPPPVSADSAPPATVPSSISELAPGDTLGALELMRTTINRINDVAMTAERRDTTMPPDGYREPRRYTLWHLAGRPVKLVATEPNDAGLMRLETITWFVNGEIAVVQEPFDIHLFDADRLVLWTDEAMVPQAVPETDRMTRERTVLDSVKARLGVFGVGYPR